MFQEIWIKISADFLNSVPDMDPALIAIACYAEAGRVVRRKIFTTEYTEARSRLRLPNYGGPQEKEEKRVDLIQKRMFQKLNQQPVRVLLSPGTRGGDAGW